MWPSRRSAPEPSVRGGRLLDSSDAITSTANDLVKYVRSLHRREVRHQEQLFVVEGLRAVEEALRAGYEPAFLFSTDVAARGNRAGVMLEEARSRGIKATTVSQAALSAMADTVNPSGILAVLPMPRPGGSSAPTLALIVDQLRDPGNMGTVLRSALAAGVDLLLATEQTVDAYSPKVVRAAMGAHFHLLMSLNQPWSAIREATRGMQVVLADVAAQGIAYWEVDWRRPTALIIGGEAEGASAEALALATAQVRIPMRVVVESLNAGVAASIMLFEAARQRTGQDRRGLENRTEQIGSEQI